MKTLTLIGGSSVCFVKTAFIYYTYIHNWLHVRASGDTTMVRGISLGLGYSQADRAVGSQYTLCDLQLARLTGVLPLQLPLRSQRAHAQ